MNDQEVQLASYTLKSLERPDWLIKAGLDKGVNHDRVNLGWILAPGSSVRFRLAPSAPDVKVALELLNTDQKAEQFAMVSKQWGGLDASAWSAVFIKTPYMDKAGESVEFEVEFMGEKKQLPVYIEGADEKAFFSLWDTVKAEFALFTSKYADVLIPVKDKEVLRVPGGLMRLSNYYNQVFVHFNCLAGLSFEAAMPTDKNIANHYFMKADKSGGGAAYYGGGWTAEVNDSVRTFWLDTQPSNWGCLHEIAHGYQGLFMNTSSVRLGEVWNNVYAASYQYRFMGDDVYRNGWLYSAGEESLYAAAKAAFDVEQTISDLTVVLFFLMLIFMRAGDQSIIEFNQRYRRISNGLGFKVENYPAMDFLSRVVVDVSGFDVSHFMKYADVSLTRQQTVENAYSGATPLFPLYRLVGRDDEEPVRKLLGLRTSLELVSRDQLLVTGTKVASVLLFEADVADKIRGKAVILKNGSGVTIIKYVAGTVLLLGSLAVGVYTVQVPSVSDGSYEANKFYVVVSPGVFGHDGFYVRKFASAIANQTIRMEGLNGTFCTIAVDVSNGELTVDIVQERPHVYFGSQVYAKVTVKDAIGRVVFDREMQGEQTALFKQVMPITKGCTVRVMHLEPSRLSVSNGGSSAIIDSVNQVNNLKVTEQGLENVELGTDPGANLKVAMERATEMYDRQPHMILQNDCPLKGDFRLAINSYPEPVRSELFERFKKIEFVPPTQHEHLYASSLITWVLQGLGGGVVGQIVFDMAFRTLEIKFFGTIPHSYFSSVYIAVVHKSADGEIRYMRELRGDALAEAETFRRPLAVGDTVSVMHREPVRSRLEADGNGQWLTAKLIQHANINDFTGVGLASYWPEVNGLTE